MDPTIKIQRLKQIDYSELRRQANDMKAAGQQSLKKCKKLAAISKNSKEQDLLKQHRAVWHKELSRLNALRKTLQRELDEQSLHALTDSDLRHHYIEFETQENHLAKERESFKEAVISPVWMLSEDIKYNVENRKQSGHGPDPEPVLDLLDVTERKLDHVGTSLAHEEEALRMDLDHDIFEDLSRAGDIRPPQTGIPEEAWDAHCPDDSLKADLVQEFLIIDAHFAERLELMKMKEVELMTIPTDGRPWRKDEIDLLEELEDSYHHHLQTGRHSLKMDMMVRCCPDRSRADLLIFDDWWIKQKAISSHKKAITTDWYRARRELLNRVKVECAEATAAFSAAANRAEQNHRQQELCNELFLRVAEWRERRLEAALLEQRLMEEEERRREAEEAEEREREARRRAKKKEKIRDFHASREEEKRRFEEEQERRLKDLRAYLDEQASHDRRRIEYRDQLLKQRQEEGRLKEEEKRAQAVDLEERLEKLRLMVRPSHVQPDPERLRQSTAAWHNRVEPTEEQLEQIAYQQPLFPTNTYSDRQVMADPRVRVENALRQAGLVHTDYARSVMSRLQPLQPPRKDLQSNIQFKDS